MLTGRRTELVRNRYDSIKSVLTGSVEVVLDLLAVELGAPGLHLEQRRPDAAATLNYGGSIRPDDSAIRESQRDLDEGVNSAGWSTEAVSDDRFRELIDRTEH